MGRESSRRATTNRWKRMVSGLKKRGREGRGRGSVVVRRAGPVRTLPKLTRTAERSSSCQDRATICSMHRVTERDRDRDRQPNQQAATCNEASKRTEFSGVDPLHSHMDLILIRGPFTNTTDITNPFTNTLTIVYLLTQKKRQLL